MNTIVDTHDKVLRGWGVYGVRVTRVRMVIGSSRGVDRNDTLLRGSINKYKAVYV